MKVKDRDQPCLSLMSQSAFQDLSLWIKDSHRDIKIII